MSDEVFGFLDTISDKEVDTSNAFPVIPASIKRCRLAGLEVKRNKANTANYLNVTWKVADGSEYDGQNVWQIVSIPVAPNSPDWQKLSTEKKEKQETVVKMFLGWMETVSGDNWGDPAQRPKLTPGYLKGLVGKTAILTITVDEYEGRPNNKVKSIKEDDGSQGGNTQVRKTL